MCSSESRQKTWEEKKNNSNCSQKKTKTETYNDNCVFTIVTLKDLKQSTMMSMKCISTFLAFCLLSTTVNAFLNNNLTIQLDAPWQKIDFLPSLIETVASYNSSLYYTTIETIFGLDDSDNDFDEDSSDKNIYEQICKNLDKYTKSFVDFDLINKKHGARVVSHYDHYQQVLSRMGDRLQKECEYDSFGNEVKKKNGQLQTWLLYNDKIYCSANDLFALRTDTSKEKTLLFDRVFGDNEEAPLLVLYGNPVEELTKEFFKVLYPDAMAGKIRFVWRYIPTFRKRQDTLPGYGVSLNMKNYDYGNGEKTSNFDLNKDLHKINDSGILIPVPEKNRDELGIKFTSFILSNRYKIHKYELLSTLLNDFPKFIPYIAKLSKLFNYEKVKTKVTANQDIGMSDESYGIYINGSPIHGLELDIYKLGNKIREELETIQNLVKLGFDSIQAKLLLTKFALLSAVKQTQFRNGNTLMGNNENRFKVYQSEFEKGNPGKGGVLFFNNIEVDVTFSEYTTNREEAYLGVSSYKLKPNQIPPLKENIHDLIFALNLANKSQLRVFFTIAKAILDSGIPQQIGLIPVIGDDPLDKEIARKFYYIAENSNTPEALALLYKYFDSANSDEAAAILNQVKVSKNFDVDYNYVLDKFSITEASVIFNGVIYDLRSPNWQIAMSKQISQDVSLIKSFLRQGPVEGKLKDKLYSNAKEKRNLRVIPLEPSEIIYKSVDTELLNESIAFKKIDKEDGVSGTFWLVSDFTKVEMFNQLIDLLSFLKKKPIQVRVVNTGDSKVFKSLHKNYKLTTLTNSQIEEIIEVLEDAELSKYDNPEVKRLLERKHLPLHHSFMLFNSRYFRLDIPLEPTELEELLEYEFTQRLNLFNDILYAYPDEFESKKLNEFNLLVSGLDSMDWFDLVSSIVTKSFHVDEKMFISDVNRFDFSSLDLSNSIDVSVNKEENPIDILVIMNPMEEYSQKLLSIVNSIKTFPFVNIRILLQPKVVSNEEIRVHRFYRGVYPSSDIQFDENTGIVVENNIAEFHNLPVDTRLSTELDVPTKWIVVSKLSSTDLDNVAFNKVVKSVNGKFLLKHILIEGFARDIHTGRTPDGLSFKLVHNNITTDTQVMSSLDYFQLKAISGISLLSSNPEYNLLSASENKYDFNHDSLDEVEVPVFSLDGVTLYPRISKGDGITKYSNRHADINIFTIAGGSLYEKLASIMIASVRKNNPELTIKFWILENYITPEFRQLMQLISKKYTVQYEFINYKWPKFLRNQKSKERTIWGYKILFLDVLFPQDLDNVIFIDADQTCRSDLTELVNMDLQGAPYGFTPMCDSRKEMEGFRFWKQGYWSDVLKDDLQYHISALYVVDLKQFRSIKAGDRLRAHYQKLSSDPNSLSNLDQDLPNNMQRQIKIFSLPQNWLWCETWCSDESFRDAKMIDLCNNPLSKENKLDMAKRLLPEWVEYEKEIDELVSNLKEILLSVEDDENEEMEDDSILFEDTGFDEEEEEEEDYHDEL